MSYLADFLIIAIWIVTAWLFVYFWTDRLYRFYFGLIIWFLLFSVFNLQIKLVELQWKSFLTSWWENFLVVNKEVVLWFFAIMVPVFGFLFMFINSEVKRNKLFSWLFWFLLPAFLLGIFAYIMINSAIELSFLKDMLAYFKDSYIFDILKKAPKLIFGLLLIIIFWKYIFAIIISLLAYFSKLIISEINDLRWEEKAAEETEKKEETRNIKLQ